MRRSEVIFIISLLQDFNTVRPLAYLAARETEADISFLISWRFGDRDTTGTWRGEIEEAAQELSANVIECGNLSRAAMLLHGRRGALVAGVDSDIPGAHGDVYQIYSVAPSSLMKITLQHGLECVGFRQNREHVIAHGRNITFGGDVVCAWLPSSELSAMVASQRARLYVTGPQMLLSRPRVAADHPPVLGGMVCENLHSVRLRASGDHGQSFMATFAEYCRVLEAGGDGLTLRPHPGGQYVLKNGVPLPPNAVLNNLPIYKVNLPAYEYGISAPSTVVLDMVLAGLPVGVWRDSAGIMDASMYDGLTAISTLEDWMAFLRDVRLRRDAILERQRSFLDDIGIIRDPAEVYRRFARLLTAALARQAPEPLRTLSPSVPTPRRVLFFANGAIPTLQLSFQKPLQPLVDAGRMRHFFAYEDEFLRQTKGKPASPDRVRAWVEDTFDKAVPDLVVACRYSGLGAEQIVQTCRDRGVPLVYHIDDDLLNLPRELGEKKYAFHMSPARTGAVRTFLAEADVVYCSTIPLRRRFREYGFRTAMTVGPIYCSGSVLVPAELRPVTRIGYMGFDHAHDFSIVVPALVQLMQAHPHLQFELFGSIPMPPELAAFGERVTAVPPVRVYAEFMDAFAARRWDIGIAPLADLPFNRVKANTKWVEYTAIGAAVVATAGTIYDGCGSDGCAVLVPDDGWFVALDRLVSDPALRFSQVQRAQARLTADYGTDRLRSQVLQVFSKAITQRQHESTGRAAPLEKI
ncbi:hypothetical protein [Roseicyclus persicicus]|uniref:Glycosyltransferase family 4 protein n=1 Tax=Roseicyclus persicicus TaxID=2650661 RepID=A0A7X6JXB1_9RHOB|nr:hypothetical protein [Roseibacterium persicicum]NKX45342.1 glycosyltransferase family 4 protein [Roseibacterium persicicum]